MTPSDLASLRATLEAQIKELNPRAFKNEEINISEQRSSDVLENAAMFQSHELTAELTTRRTTKIKAIEAALERMERNEYGICEDCGEPIPLKRLNAVPWATVCVPCQELRDREGVRDAA